MPSSPRLQACSKMVALLTSASPVVQPQPRARCREQARQIGLAPFDRVRPVSSRALTLFAAAKSLLFAKNSLISGRKFPVAWGREFGHKPLKLLAD